ncbi:carboxypeptidase-like regulatory domain-containing protein [Mangrovivirga sp. M17]|uniref:Carboxypeptidase-like regulatory domain-containing protein n=1 Tax=Mangrovivirga halotolerans TaxID=2993936 RepID=A0ABT3RMZ2_9BACT|nr:carboxypeptidase-like regulatory domain-containing protein [Mangrovivirga halotolerans]MCX2743177.1 carboxypeptidase-like regulatory domain-containing protein [Mangrovivirga halotolerans]
MAKLIYFSIFILLSNTGFCQNKKYFGQVIDKETQKPLEGANIIIKNTGKGTSTDREGKFEIERLYDNKEVEVSYIGYQSTPHRLKGRSTNIIQLEKETLIIDHIDLRLGEYKGPSTYITKKEFESKNTYTQSVNPNFTIIEEPASFHGGVANLYAFFAANFQYNQSMLEQKSTGSVIVQFTINEEGSAENIKFFKEINLSNQVKKEILNTFKTMPNWKPASQRGREVKQHFITTISFGDNRNQN